VQFMQQAFQAGGTRSSVVSRLLSFAIALFAVLAIASSAHAAIYWLDSSSNDAGPHYRTGEEACVTGEMKTRINARRAAETNPNVKFRYNSLNIGPDEGIGERVCRGVIERTYASFWVTVEMVDTTVNGPMGNADPCSLANYSDPDTGQCGRPKCTTPCCGQCGNGSNPIHSASGNKFQRETDLISGGLFPLQIERYYNSNHTLENAPVPLGVGWSHTYQRSIVAYPSVSGGGIDSAVVYRADGKMQKFSLVGTVWTTDADTVERLQWQSSNAGATGWTYITRDDETETYDAQGRLSTITNRTGLTQTLSYLDSTGRPRDNVQKVTGPDGRILTFAYNSAGQIASVTDNLGKVYGYTYDSTGNLSSVQYPDSSGSPKTRTYLYNEAGQNGGVAQAHALTGIVDENGNRYASWAYDGSGRGTLSVHGAYSGGTANRTSIAFNADGTTTVTDALAKSRTFGFTAQLGVARSTLLDTPCDYCGQSATTQSFDANGNVAAATDFNGSVTTYNYDLTRNLETSRVEASGTTQARTITTSWHATYRLPLQIAEPKVLTTYAYDATGNLLSKTIQATSDATGAQGLSPTLVGTARTWNYTYNTLGQVLTATGPRTDIMDKTTYTYDASSNLSTITNAAGQVTTLSNYDANGRVGLITDANGATTALTYSPRGWLTGKTVTSGGTVEITTYGYDGVGQLTVVTLPNASTVSYTYDVAHRLTNITDSLGNSIVYTLDNMGNRIGEQVKDPSGALARQTSRVITALNRLQQVTGAVQ
jgi:YD repeat-containing protein